MNGERLAKINSTTGAVFHYINDHLGTPVKMTDQNGLVVWSADYMPFGEAYVDSQSTQENPFRYPGQYYDEETGLHYNLFRYYDPELGRYLEADPIGQAGGLNLYAYASNSPVMFIDPLGLCKKHPLGVYRSSNIIGIYANDPVIYKDTDYKFHGALTGNLKPEYGAAGTIATGEIIDGSTRIYVYGNPDSNKPSSWIVGKMGKSDQIDPVTGWKYYKFRPVTENEANKLPITNKAIIKFQ